MQDGARLSPYSGRAPSLTAGAATRPKAAEWRRRVSGRPAVDLTFGHRGQFLIGRLLLIEGLLQ
jgi:hypothetical protein